MEILPEEIIAQIMHLLDIKSLVQISQVSFYYYQHLHQHLLTHLERVKKCCNDLACQPLIESAVLTKDLLTGNLNLESFYKASKAQDVSQLQELLFANSINPNREFVLYAPFYEKHIPCFFPRSGLSTRTLYLTKALAEKNTANAINAKHWLRVIVTMSKEQFPNFYQTQTFQSPATILPLQVYSEEIAKKKARLTSHAIG